MALIRNTSTILAAGMALGLVATGIAPAQDAGPYLAARQAAMLSDYDQATRYYTRAIASGPQNLELQEASIIAFIGHGDIDTAATISRRLEQDGRGNQVTDLVLNADTMAAGSFERVADLATSGDDLSHLLNGLLKGWAKFGQGQMSGALEAFESVAAVEDFASFARYHEALALALVGDFEAADDILSGTRYGVLTMSPRGLEAHAQVLIQLERTDDALALINAALSQRFSAELSSLAEEISAGGDPQFDFISTAQDGAAEVLYNMAIIVNGRAVTETVLIYARMAEHLSESHVPSRLLIAELLEDLDQFDLASKSYASVPSDHPSFFLAEMGRADALYANEQKEAAVEVLSTLSRSHGEIAMVHASFGDMLSRMRRDDEAIAAYSRSLEMREPDEVSTWPIFYARGIVHERLGNMELMETDFRKALDLSPDQPDVLNYLGYSLVEQRIKLDEALGMIETAVARRPESGYITDSLGWILYRLGRYEEAVEPMEKAVSLLPVDPIVNDHLGDVYYKVGRAREAEFQWKRALSFDPEEDEAIRIRRKLEVGLDKVLEEEAAPGSTETAKD
ncbi:MAG: tetratricopeptide repeat protein [Pseudomonadota bacterium]